MTSEPVSADERSQVIRLFEEELNQAIIAGWLDKREINRLILGGKDFKVRLGGLIANILSAPYGGLGVSLGCSGRAQD